MMTLIEAMALVNAHFHEDDGIAASPKVKESWDIIRNYITTTIGLIMKRGER